MKRAGIVLALCLLAFVPPSKAQTAPDTGIEGVAGMRLYASDLEKSREFYRLLGLDACSSDAALCFMITPFQRLELDLSKEKTDSQLEYVAYQVRSAANLRSYLIKAGVHAGELKQAGRAKYFEALDPENHRIRFIQYSGFRMVGAPRTANQTSEHIIHVGYVVRDRFSTDHFYKDILGFRPYWHGGMKDDKDDWVALQVPDGTDWIEYMLNIPVDANHHTLGVMNHVALGVTDIQAAKTQLLKNGWKPGEEPKLGRDGKWQLNVYDPDDTRIEFMEFTPKEKPCCSEFTGPHPKR